MKNSQNSFNIEFSTLNFHEFSSNRYTYILENYEKEWNPVTKYNSAVYRNIPPGKYIFKVKGRNSFGVWNNYETRLEIVVVPPFWKSPLAIIFYILVLGILGFIGLKLAYRMNKLHNAITVEKQLTEYKLRFFTNISHEFRTPLTIIRGTIENLVNKNNLPDSIHKQIKILEKSSDRLMRLIDQLLEFRRLQNNKMELNLEKTEVISFFRDIYNVFIETAENKNISFLFETNEPEWEMPLDKSKMDKIAYNLLSNAFKYTDKNGTVKMEIKIDIKNEKLQFIVSDNGMGVPKEKQSMLFKRFRQINYSSSGTGIGLHLTSELAGVHQGSIHYSESESGGSCFTVTIPLFEKNYDIQKIMFPVSPEKVEEIIPVTDTLYESQPKENDFLENEILAVYNQATKNNKILVIEDDEEVRSFLSSQLEQYFTVLTAENGKKGLEKATSDQPDLIICDVMMPEMNGFEVTQHLKQNFNSSHIPIIILTAHSSLEHQLEGIQSGADAYITKPFSVKYLIVRIMKLIEQRETLQQKYIKEPGLIKPVSASGTTIKDREFIEKIHNIITENLGNADFSLEEFAQLAGLGRTIFFKKN